MQDEPTVSHGVSERKEKLKQMIWEYQKDTGAHFEELLIAKSGKS